ncbi:MAG TPA: sugar ABC transporter permease [Bacilli bacterium]|nr:sugar ABC transporter permease [Bacilli bacterium]
MGNESTQVKKSKKLSRFIKVTSYTYRTGNNVTRMNLILSYLFFFVPFFVRKQLIKAVTYFLIYVFYVYYMIKMGANSISHLINLNTYIGDRRQPLVYGILTLVLTFFFIFSYVKAIRDTLKLENAIVNKKKVINYKGEWEELKHDKAYFVMLIIPILGAVAFTILPLLFMISLAFTDYNIAKQIGINNFSWSGFNSFRLLFDGGSNFKAFTNVFSWTMVWSFFATITCYFGGFFLALLLAKKMLKLKKLWRSLFVITIAVPQFVSLRVMYAMFHDYGPINTLIVNLGGSRIEFWNNVTIARILIIFTNMWVGIPFFMLIISGLLLSIPKENYEAAEIDGASKWQIFKSITFPYILFATTPLLITQFVHNMNNFNVIWLLTGGGPMGQGTGGVAGGTDIFITWLYKLTMYNLNVAEYDIGAAIGIIMFIISAVISLVIFRRTSAYQSEEEFQR